MAIMDYYVSFGSNIEPEKNIAAMLAKLEALSHLTVVKVSQLYKTAPWGKTDQAPFLNGVVHFTSQLPPSLLFKDLQRLELELGRERIIKWGPRTIDLDVIWVEENSNPITINTKMLQIPHPYFWDRNFVLVPLAEIYSNFTYKKQRIKSRIQELEALEKGEN